MLIRQRLHHISRPQPHFISSTNLRNLVSFSAYKYTENTQQLTCSIPPGFPPRFFGAVV
nr:MAG TPA_asm: hypothetical protein [Bacteriophage sp.]DAW41653.1 MAG TPA: hypothetical protein [Caudoviricetes sp.]